MVNMYITDYSITAGNPINLSMDKISGIEIQTQNGSTLKIGNEKDNVISIDSDYYCIPIKTGIYYDLDLYVDLDRDDNITVIIYR